MFLLEWTPLITSDSFTPVQTDVTTAVVGIIAVIMAIAGGLIIIKLIKNF